MRRKSNKIRTIVCGGILVMILTAFLSCVHSRYEISIENTITNSMIFTSPANPGDNLWLVYINSVESLPVAEHYEVDHNYTIIFTETIYQAPYVGYLNPEKAQIVAPGTIKISGYDRPFKTVTFYAGDISRHMLFWNGKWIPLYDSAQGGDLIRITLRKTSGSSLFSRKEVVP